MQTEKNNQQMKYELLELDDKRLTYLYKDIVEISEIEFNRGSLLTLKNNKYLVQGKFIGKYMILYHDKDLLDKHIKDEYFPIEEPLIDSVYELEKNNIKNIEDNIDVYIQYVEKKYDLKNIISYKISVQNHLDELSKKINKTSLDKLTDYDKLCLSLYIDNIFREKTNTKWYLEKVFTLNPYWVPTLISENGEKHSASRFFFISLNKYKYLDLYLSFKTAIDDYDGNSHIVPEIDSRR